ncbi:MAG: hypothetical protein ACR5LA_03235 [Wolbachia sp.]
MSIVLSQNSLLLSQCVTHNCTSIVFVPRCGVIPIFDTGIQILLLVCAFMRNIKIICRQSLLDLSVKYWKKGQVFSNPHIKKSK